jgi:tetratricopeptide (TPR) repeat protein
MVDDETPPDIVANLKRVEAFLNTALLRFEAARESAEAALQRFRELGDEKEIATAQYLAGRALIALGRVSEAGPMLQEALDTFRRLKSNRLAGVTLGTLAMAREHSREYAAARSMYAEALTTFKAVNDDRDAAVVATHLSWIEFNEGNLEAAVRILGEALATFRQLNDVPNLVDGHTSMAEYAIILERYDEGREHAREAVALAAREQLETHRAVALAHLAATAVLRPSEGDERAGISNAARLLGYSDACFARLGFRRNPGEQQLYDKVMHALNEAIGKREVERLAADGATWSEERAVAEGLAI